MNVNRAAACLFLCCLAAVVANRGAHGAPVDTSVYPRASGLVVAPRRAESGGATHAAIEPALTIVAADAPRPVDAGLAQGRSLAGRFYLPAVASGSVALGALPWTLDRERGELRAAIAVALPHAAAAIKVAVVGENLASTLTVRFVGQETDMARVLDAPTRLETGAGTPAWSSTMSGSRLVVELARPADVPVGGDERLRVTQIGELFMPAADAKTVSGGGQRAKTASACFRDAACETAVEASSSGVVLLEIATGDAIYLCTGALLRGVDDGRLRASVLTAGHCLADAVGVTAYFGYRSQGCNGPSPSPLTLDRMSRLGPFLFDDESDFGLVDLPGPVPPGVTLLGWSAAPFAAGEELAALHHARGGVLGVFRARVSEGRYPYVTKSGQVLEMPLFEGTEPGIGLSTGASGAPFIDSAGEVRGLVSSGVGASQQCSDGQAYASLIAGPQFARVYPAIAAYLDGTVPPPPSAPEEGDLRSVGGQSYSLLGANQLRLVVDRIENTSMVAPTGALRASTCAAESKESTSCQPLWQVLRDALPPGGTYEPLSITESFAPPAAGSYYLRFVLEEIESVGPRRILLAQSIQAETFVAPPPTRVCVKYKKRVCRKWKTQ